MLLKCLFLLIFVLGCASTPKLRQDKLSIVQGVTGPNEVEFSIVAPQGKNLHFELRDIEGGILTPDESKVIQRDHSSFAVHKVFFEKEDKKDYNLYVFEGQSLLDQRLIGKALANPNQLKIAVASCMNDFHKDDFKIWTELTARNPDYILMVGDNVYADKDENGKSVTVTPSSLWDRYVDVRLRLPVFFQEKLIPVHALWDDHDFGLNDGNSNFEHKHASREVFEAFWAQSESEENWIKGPGVGGLLSVGDFNFFFLDGRSFRSADADGKHLGDEQEKWLFSKLRDESGPSFLIKGDQFFGGYHDGDSFEGKHPKDFTKFVSELGKTKTPFVFLSGDRHLSEIMQFPRGLFERPSFEITSSPVHSNMNENPDVPNPWRVVAEKHDVNFIMISNEARDNHWFMDVESINALGEVAFKREIAVYIKDLQNNLQESRKKRRGGSRRYRRGRGRRRR